MGENGGFLLLLGWVSAWVGCTRFVGLFGFLVFWLKKDCFVVL